MTVNNALVIGAGVGGLGAAAALSQRGVEVDVVDFHLNDRICAIVISRGGLIGVSFATEMETLHDRGSDKSGTIASINITRHRLAIFET